jgi:hypothetical protein
MLDHIIFQCFFASFYHVQRREGVGIFQFNDSPSIPENGRNFQFSKRWIKEQYARTFMVDLFPDPKAQLGDTVYLGAYLQAPETSPVLHYSQLVDSLSRMAWLRTQASSILPIPKWFE